MDFYKKYTKRRKAVRMRERTGHGELEELERRLNLQLLPPVPLQACENKSKVRFIIFKSRWVSLPLTPSNWLTGPQTKSKRPFSDYRAVKRAIAVIASTILSISSRVLKAPRLKRTPPRGLVPRS